MEPGAPPEDAGTAPAEDEEEALDFDGDYQKSLRHSWEFAAVAQFCRLFSSALRLRPFSADQLEAALLEPDEHPMFLGELLYKLLKKERDEAYTEKAAFSWEPMLVRKLDAQWSQAFTAHPMTNTDFYTIDPLSRMNIMYALCEWRLDEDNAVREHVRQQVDTSDMADTLRHLPIGEDSKGCRYYFFSDSQEDCRLYREEPPRKRLSKKQAHREHLALWDTVCTTLEEISDFAARLGGSRNRSDKALHEVLTLELLPKLIDTVSARKKADERAAALEAMPKKRSSRLQVLQIKKEEEEKKKKEEDEERSRMLKEQERVRKDRDREMRLRARQDEEERMLMHAAQLRKKLGVMDPSREERYSKRIKNADDSSNPSPGISGLTDTEHVESFQELNQQQSEQERDQQAEQEQHDGENGMPLSAAPQQAVKQDVLLQPEAEPVQPPQPINLYPNFPMPPEMHMGMTSTSPAADPWQSEEQQDGGFMPQGRQLRQRHQQRAKGRKREHSPGWSPIGVHVEKRLRHVNTRRSSNMSVLAKFGKPLPPPRLDDYYEGADLSSSSESEEKPQPRSRGRRRRAKSEDSDPDYEGERSERSGGRTMRGRGARRTTAASNANAHAQQEHAYSHSYMQAQRQQQEQHYQRQQLMARYQSATPLEQERIRQQLMAQRQQQMMQQQGFAPGLSPSMPGSPTMGGFDSQAALRQQMAMQQRQEAMRLLSTLAPEQREQLSRLPPLQQNQFLEQLRQNHMAQQREAARQQQAAAADAHRQQDLQQRMLASLSAQQLQQLRSMPREAQQASLNGLIQRYHMVEQQRQMQRQHAMQMGQTLDPADTSIMQNNQHASGPQAFLQQQQMPPGQMMGDQAFSPRSMQSHAHFSQGQPSSPGLHRSMPDPGMEDWRKQGLQSGPQRSNPTSAMLEPLEVEFGQRGGSGAAAQRPLHAGGSALSPVPGAQVPSRQSQAAFDHRDGSGAGGHSPGLNSRSSLHGCKLPEGHRFDGTEQGAATQGDVSGSPRYGAPVTTGHDKQQLSAQAHGASDRLNASSAQVTSGAPQPLKAGMGQQAHTQQNASQLRPASSAEPPLVIITSSTPPAMGLKSPAQFEMGSEAPTGPQHDGSSNAAGQPDAGAEEERCPSPIPVTLDDFRSGQAEETGVSDLQGLELPWASQKSQSLAGSPIQEELGPAPPVEDRSSD